MKSLWIVGQYITEDAIGVVWDFGGVFDSQELAENACFNRNCFVAPATLNMLAPAEERWTGCYYPMRKTNI